MVKLSVVIPTFNRRATLERSIETALSLSQGLPIEFVIVDDGSTDSTPMLLEQLADRHRNLRYVTKENAGPGSARNVGAAMAAGQIVLFMGDDTRPVSEDLFKSHLRIHERYPEKTTAVLGKVEWPQEPSYNVSFVMSLIQGEGGQQFGFAHMRPYARYDWRFFYTANVSVKTDVVEDWLSDGFSDRFKLAAFEDGELAYRLTKQLGAFSVLYSPAALAVHDHEYSLEQFLGRQYAAGMMASTLHELHPEVAELIGVAELVTAMSAPATGLRDDLDHADYLAVIEGVFAAARLLDRRHNVGSTAWHVGFVNAVFELAYAAGFVLAYPGDAANRTQAYQVALARFDRRIEALLEHVQLAQYAPLQTATALGRPTLSRRRRELLDGLRQHPLALRVKPFIKRLIRR